MPEIIQNPTIVTPYCSRTYVFLHPKEMVAGNKLRCGQACGGVACDAVLGISAMSGRPNESGVPAATDHLDSRLVAAFVESVCAQDD